MTTNTTTSPATETKGRSRLRALLVVAVVLVVTLSGVVWYLVKPAAPEGPVAGEVMTLEPIQLNLAAGHYLRVGIALQLTEEAVEVDGSKALDATIGVFSNRELSDVTSNDQREELRTELLKHLELAYPDTVMDVYYTEFVTQ